MTFHSSILGIVPGLQSLAVAGQGLALVPKNIGGNMGKITFGPKKMVQAFTGIMIGTALIRPTANIIRGI
jgi:hypothetical protein